jgi:hypothetical protein
VGLRAPPARHSMRFSFNVVYLLVFGFTHANRPARQVRGRGEWNRSPVKLRLMAPYAPPPGPPAPQCPRSRPNRPLPFRASPHATLSSPTVIDRRTSPPARWAQWPSASHGWAGVGLMAG